MATWKQLSIYTSAGTRWGVRPLHEAAIASALDAGIPTAMVFQTLAGFGPQLAIPTANHLALPSDLPLEIRLLGEGAAIDAFIENQEAMLKTCVVATLSLEVSAS